MFKAPATGHIFTYITTGASAFFDLFTRMFNNGSTVTIIGLLAAVMFISLFVRFIRQRG